MSVNIKEQDGLKPIAGQAESVTIVDNLTTESSTEALSAKQGKILKDLIDEGGSASIDYGDETTFNEWSKTAQDGEIFVRTDDNADGGGSLVNIFIDTSRILINDANLVDGSEYTATENCFIVIENRTNSSNDGHGFDVLIDNVIVFRPYSRNTSSVYISRPISFYMKKGQTFKIVVNDRMPTNLTFKSFGLF